MRQLLLRALFLLTAQTAAQIYNGVNQLCQGNSNCSQGLSCINYEYRSRFFKVSTLSFLFCRAVALPLSPSVSRSLSVSLPVSLCPCLFLSLPVSQPSSHPLRRRSSSPRDRFPLALPLPSVGYPALLFSIQRTRYLPNCSRGTGLRMHRSDDGRNQLRDTMPKNTGETVQRCVSDVKQTVSFMSSASCRQDSYFEFSRS
eukprot:2791911-Rhodomonas_salina.2